MTRVAVAVIGTNLVFDYGTPEAARLAMEALEAEAQSTPQPEAAGEAGLRAALRAIVGPPSTGTHSCWATAKLANVRAAIAAPALPE